MKRFEATLGALVLTICSSGAWGQGLRAVKPVPGWQCMKLNLTEQQSMDPSVHVLERRGPSAQSPVGGWAPITVAVPSPAVSNNGFLPVLRPNGQRLWISDRDVVKWASVSDPTARCVPSFMSNGIIGFDYPR